MFVAFKFWGVACIKHVPLALQEADLKSFGHDPPIQGSLCDIGLDFNWLTTSQVESIDQRKHQQWFDNVLWMSVAQFADAKEISVSNALLPDLPIQGIPASMRSGPWQTTARKRTNSTPLMSRGLQKSFSFTVLLVILLILSHSSASRGFWNLAETCWDEEVISAYDYKLSKEV